MITKTQENELVIAATLARQAAYAPYSKFAVGAALLTKRGEIFLGTNVENSSFGATVCAERVAVFSAVTAGRTEFEAIAIIADTGQPIRPCGICRQVLSEFGMDIVVIAANTTGMRDILKLDSYLPLKFNLNGK